MAGKTKSVVKTRKTLSVKDLSNEQVKVFQDVSKNSKLQHILLMESHFKCSHVEYFKAVEKELIEFSYGSSVKALNYDKETGNSFVVFDWEVEAINQNAEDNAKSIVAINSTYMVRYDISGSFDSEIVELFLRHVGKVASYPYFRNQVAQKSWESDLELPILPVISA